VEKSPKQQVLSALKREPQDKIPFDLFEGWMWPGIGKRLMQRLGARNEQELWQILGFACRWLTPWYVGPELPAGAKDRVASPHTTHSLNGCIWGLQPGLREHGVGRRGHPLGDAETIRDVARYQWPSRVWFDYDGLRRQAERCRDFFVVVGGFTPLFYLIGDLCGMEKALMDLSLNPRFVHALCERIEGFYQGYFRDIAAACGPAIDAIAFGDDFSSQLGLLMSPDQWREFFLPVWSRLFGQAKDRGYKVMFHSCGSVYEIIPYLIEAGLDILYPVQPKARFMALELLRREFGSFLSFYGGFDVQQILPFGSVLDVEREVDRIVGLFKGQGGYVLSTSHVITEDVPEDNVIRLYERMREIEKT
jgi:uroporphyrinogen decarboxylase